MSQSNLEFLGRLDFITAIRDLQIRVNRLERFGDGSDDSIGGIEETVLGEAEALKGVPSLRQINARYTGGYPAYREATPNALLPLDPNANIDLRRAGGEIFANRVTAGYSDNTAIMDGVDTTYRFWVGASNAGSATFSVTQTGAMYATSGSIAGMDISGCQLSIPSIYDYALRIYDSDYAAKPTLLGFQVVKALGLAIGAMNVLQTDANEPILQLQSTASDLTSAVVRLKAASGGGRTLEIGSSGSIDVSVIGRLAISADHRLGMDGTTGSVYTVYEAGASQLDTYVSGTLVRRASSACQQLLNPVTVRDAPSGSVIADIAASGTTVGGHLKANKFISFPDPTDLTVSSCAITVTQTYHTVTHSGGATACDLHTITGASTGRILILRTTNDTNDITLKDAAAGGNLRLAGDFTLDDADDTIMLLGHTTFWFELARSNNS